MDTALVVAGVSLAGAIGSAVLSARAQRRSAKVQLEVAELQARRERELREEEQRSKAKDVLDRYRAPLLDAAWQLGNRIDNVRHRKFLEYLAEGSGREQDAKLTTLFRFAQYFGWREFVRTEVQLLRFEKEEDTRLVSRFLNDVAWLFSSSGIDDGRAMLWADEQRGIGQLMINGPSESPPVRGHAAFYRDYDDAFASWLERFATDVLSPAAVGSDRMRLLQWALFGLVKQLDDEHEYGESDWEMRAEQEIRQAAWAEGRPSAEIRLRKDLAELGLLGAARK